MSLRWPCFGFNLEVLDPGSRLQTLHFVPGVGFQELLFAGSIGTPKAQWSSHRHTLATLPDLRYAEVSGLRSPWSRKDFALEGKTWFILKSFESWSFQCSVAFGHVEAKHANRFLQNVHSATLLLKDTKGWPAQQQHQQLNKVSNTPTPPLQDDVRLARTTFFLLLHSYGVWR